MKDRKTYLITGGLHSICVILSTIGLILAIKKKSSALRIILRSITTIGFAVVALMEFNIFSDFKLLPFRKN